MASMHWPTLLNWNRFSDDRRWPIEPSRSPWQIDYDRIVFSSAFRRLQDKTQVFPLSGSDYVRTRLTHTLEVSTVARTLGAIAGSTILARHGKELVKNKDQPSRLDKLLTPGDFGAILAAAALAHDLGNPPFGHSGEDSVRHWFDTNSRLKMARIKLSQAQQEDFRSWEGNAQGFRIITNLQTYRGRGGMRLTNSTLATFCKYPRQSTISDSDSKGARASSKKFGFFQSELSAFESVASATGLIRRDSSNAWCRHPLAFLLEAADDVCYRIIDLEDGFRMKQVPYETVVELLRSIATEVTRGRMASEADDLARISYLRAVSIRTLVEQVSEAFADSESGMLKGTFDRELCAEIKSKAAIAAIKATMSSHVYVARNVLETEAAGFQIIPGLLDLFWLAVSAESTQKNYRRAHKVLELIPPDFRGPKGIEREAIYERMLRIADYVTGMTDSYALSLFRKLNGIALPT